ncbi:MAG TPA: hypothetical protein EYF98_02795 [Planctomycetes bacterium]|nr:hypothetical protein [Planctomycetota bacterium]
MSKRSPLLSLAYAAALFVAAMVWLFSTPHARTFSPRAEQSQARQDERPILLGPEADAKNALRSQLNDVPASTVHAADGQAAQPLQIPVVQGTCVLIDANGHKQTQVNGRFRFLSRREGQREWTSVGILNGQFEFMIHAPDEFWFADFELDDCNASVRRGAILTGPLADLRLDLVALESRGATFHVVDGASGEQLSGVEVAILQNFDGDSLIHPDATATSDENLDFVVENGVSPVLVERSEDDQDLHLHSYWVRAEGYAWTRVDVNFTFGGEYRVPLVAAGGLTVRVLDGEGALFRGVYSFMTLRREEGGPILSYGAPDESMTCHWEALPAGSFVVGLEEEHRVMSTRTLCSARVTIAPGATSQAELRPTPGAISFGPLPCTGTVRSARHWVENGLSIEFVFDPTGTERAESARTVYAKDLIQDPHAPGLYHWATELECPGTWQAITRASSTCVYFEVGLQGAHGVELVIPDPVQLRLRIVDKLEGFALLQPIIHTGYDGPPLEHSYFYLDITHERASGTHILTLPAGELSLSLSCEGYAQVEDTLTLPPEGLELTYELERSIRIQPLFWDDNAQVAVSLLDSKLRLNHLDGDGKLDVVYWDYFTVTKPGRYQIAVEGVPFYPTLSTVITVPQVGTVDIPLELAEREH